MKRINKSISSSMEDRILSAIVLLIPKWITPDILTLIALLSSIVGGIFYIYVNYNFSFLLIINICLIIHWLADGLDGRLARLRKQCRNRYGYYIDHMLDSFSAVLFLGGISISKLTLTSSWIWVLSLMLLSMIHVFLKAAVYNKFEFSLQQTGPTEARLSLFIINIIIFFIGNPQFNFFKIYFTLFDIIGWLVIIGFLIILIPEVIKTSISLDKEDREKIRP